MPTRETAKRIRKRLLLWGILSVVVSLLPIASKLIVAVVNAKPITSIYLCRDGEFAIIAAGIAAAAIIDLVKSQNCDKIMGQISAGLCIIVACLASVAFTSINALSAVDPAKEKAIIRLSIIIFLLALLVGAICVVVSEWGDENSKVA